MAIRAVDDAIEQRRSSPRRLPGGTGQRPARQSGAVPHAACPGDARHPPRCPREGVAARVRRDAPQRPGQRSRERHPGTRARKRPATLPSAARIGRAGRRSAPGSICTPTPPRPDGNPIPSPSRTAGKLRITKSARDATRPRSCGTQRAWTPRSTVARKLSRISARVAFGCSWLVISIAYSPSRKNCAVRSASAPG